MKRPHYTGAEPCTQVGPDLFYEFPLNGAVTHEMRVAIGMCYSCPLMHACREYAIQHEEWGIWGGLLPKVRENERRRRGIQLDRKHHLEWIPGRAA